MDTNVNNLSEENKAPVYVKTETKGDSIREEIEDNTIRIIYVQSKPLKDHATKLKEKLNYDLKEANDAKLSQKYEKFQVIDLQELMDKIILKLATLKSSVCLNMQQLRE